MIETGGSLRRLVEVVGVGGVSVVTVGGDLWWRILVVLMVKICGG